MRIALALFLALFACNTASASGMVSRALAQSKKVQRQSGYGAALSTMAEALRSTLHVLPSLGNQEDRDVVARGRQQISLVFTKSSQAGAQRDWTPAGNIGMRFAHALVTELGPNGAKRYAGELVTFAKRDQSRTGWLKVAQENAKLIDEAVRVQAGQPKLAPRTKPAKATKAAATTAPATEAAATEPAATESAASAVASRPVVVELAGE